MRSGVSFTRPAHLSLEIGKWDCCLDMSSFLPLARKKTNPETLHLMTGPLPCASSLRVAPACLPIQSPRFFRGDTAAAGVITKIRPCLAHRSTWFPLFLQSSGILGAFFLEQETYSCRRVVSWEGKRSWIRVRVPQLHAWCGQCYGQVQSGDFHLSVRPGLGDAVYYVQDSKAHSSQNMMSVSSLPPTPN